MKSCIFVNKDTPKFKGAREELHVINCTPRGCSSREALAQETAVPVENGASSCTEAGKTFCLLWKQMVLTKQQDHKLKKVKSKREHCWGGVLALEIKSLG